MPTTIKVRENGPLKVTGDFELIDHEGNRLAESGDVVLCRCGRSATPPFCDASHRSVGWSPGSSGSDAR